MTLGTALGTASPIIPYVEEPDGTVILTSTTFNPAVTSLQTTSLVVNDPPFGTYHFGYQIPAFAAVTTFTINDQTITSRDGVTTAYPMVPSIGPLVSPTQINNDFTYGPSGTVPQ
jgi:hypothetical protein